MKVVAHAAVGNFGHEFRDPLVPDGVRRTILRSVPTESTAAGAFGGTPSVAHAGGAVARPSSCGDRARPAARRDRDRCARHTPLSHAATESADRGLPRARARRSACGAMLPGGRRRHRDPRQPVLTPLRAPDAAAVSRVLPRDAHGPRPEAPRRAEATVAADPRAIALVSQRTYGAPAAAVSRLERLPARARPPRRRDRGGNRRRRGRPRNSASCRRTASAPRSSWRPRPRRRRSRASASCSPLRTLPLRVGGGGTGRRGSPAASPTRSTTSPRRAWPPS